MTRTARRLVPHLLAAALLSLPAVAPAQTTTTPGKPGARGKPAPQAKTAPAGPAATRFRVVLDAVGAFGSLSYGDTRTPTAYAEPSTIRTSYEAGSGFGFDASLQVSVFRGLGLLVGYASTSRDVTGSVDVTRPHPLYLNRPRSAQAELSGYGYTEGALDVDVAFAREAGQLDWALFAGVTFFDVEADLLEAPVFDERYPYDELSITSTPARAQTGTATGFNVGGRLDYRFGASRRFGVGVSARYRAGSVTLNAGQDAQDAAIDAGGFSAGAGIRVYF